MVEALDDVTAAPSVVCIGVFDGVHLGHREIIDRARSCATELGVRSAIVTFDRHPMEVVRPDSAPPLLQTPAGRARTLAEAGADLVVVLPFDDELRQLSPEAFVDRALGERLHPRRVVVGGNFRFGHKAAGDVNTLRELGATRGFDVDAVDLLEIDGVVVSSTEIRRRLAAGDVEGAAQLLGRPAAVEGPVVRGDRRGTDLGFPTLNVAVDGRMAVPASGVYAGVAHLPDGRAVDAVSNIGTNPTFGGTSLRVEAHLLDFDEDLYGAEVAVDFRARLRDEVRYDGPEALVSQMRQDVAEARSRLAQQRR